MSVTFSMNQAPVERYQPEPIDDPEWFSIRPVAPFTEINLGNSNAIAIMQLIDPQNVHYDDESVNVYGEWDMAKLDVVYKRVMTLLNKPRKQEPLYFDPFVSSKPGCMTVYHGGRDQDYTERTLTHFLEMINVARQHEFPISFG
jgi:hypothetical protein